MGTRPPTPPKQEQGMTVSQSTDLYWDPYDVELNMDPYPLFRRLRDEAPLYYNDRYDFYALTRADDVEQAYVDYKRLINGKSAIVAYIRSGMEFPTGCTRRCRTCR